MATRKKTRRTTARRTKTRKPRSTGRKAAGKARADTTRKRAAARAKVARKQASGGLDLRAATPGFTVNDIHKSLAFYRDVLGFAVKERWEHDGELRGAEMKAGRVSFYLGQDDWKKGRDRAKGQGFRIYCTTSQDLDQLVGRIKAGGGTLIEELETRPWGSRDFAVADPDGFKITISSSSGG